jgi:hypothetical protein
MILPAKRLHLDLCYKLKALADSNKEHPKPATIAPILALDSTIDRKKKTRNFLNYLRLIYTLPNKTIKHIYK